MELIEKRKVKINNLVCNQTQMYKTAEIGLKDYTKLT